MPTVKKIAMVAISLLSASLVTSQAQAQNSGQTEAHNVVLVHGAWADGSSWSEVIPLLQAAGLRVTAVQNPLTSIADAPDAGEDFVALSGKFPTTPLRAGVQERDGFTTISEEAFLKYFANGVPQERAKVLYAVQEPTAASLFSGRTTAAAWHSKPSWYAVSKLDETIAPDLERFLANRMQANTVELEAGHLSLVSHPKQIADLILAAAGRGGSDGRAR
jgi:pimeloyl-ACP methyl ester carboxylesterase